MRFSLLSASSVQAAPFCVGFAFRKGDIPAGSTVVSSQVATLQVTARNAWPDGSLKFALLAGRADLSAGTGLGVTLRRAGSSSASGTALTTADLRRTAITAEVACGSYGTVAWAGADWDAPFKTVASGPVMSSWIYRKAVGSDAHLVAWLEVRHFVGGSVEVLPWIENGYINVASPSNRSATYRFTLGGSERFNALVDLKHHQRTPLVSGAALSYWAGTAGELTVQHDALYMMASELVPSYFTRSGATDGLVAALPAAYTPLQRGSFNYDGDSMASSGYQDPIGLLPQHDVLYLTADSPNVFAAVVRNGYSAGRWGIHYRDEATQRPLRFTQHPTRVITDFQGFKDNGSSSTGTRTPVATGGNPPTWDIAHSPCVGYMAYLVTGRWYFMEEVQFSTTANYLGNGDNTALRTGSQGLVQTAVDAWQTRSCAWDWRARVQALTVTPDDDVDLRSEFIRSVELNIDHFYGRYVAQPNNPYGWVMPGEQYNGGLDEGANWQQDFVTAAFGWSVAMDLPLSAAAKTKLNAFFQWKARSAVLRLGPVSDFWFVNGSPYTMRIGTGLSVASYANGTGPWLPNAAAVYAATYATRPSWFSQTEGVLSSEYDIGSWPRAMWGNLQPAISYAVRLGVPGALDAYNRMVSASNWPAIQSGLESRPVWGVRPLRSQPAWLANKPLNEWFAIPNTSGAGGSSVNAFCGFALRPDTGEIFIAAAGGHQDSADNRVVSIGLMADQPSWSLRIAPSAVVQQDVAYYADGKPSSRHTYQTSHWVPALGRVMLMGERFAYGNAFQFPTVDGFDPNRNAWDARGTYANMPAGYGAVVDGRGFVWSNVLGRWNPSTRTWTSPIANTNGAAFVRWPYAYDAARNQIFGLCFADGEGYGARVVNAVRVPVEGAAAFPVTFNPSAALTQFIADAPTYAGMDYDVANDRFFFYSGQGTAAGRVYVVTPNDGNTWDMAILSLGAGSVTPADPGGAGINNRLRYVPALQGFVLLANGNSNLYFMRTT